MLCLACLPLLVSAASAADIKTVSTDATGKPILEKGMAAESIIMLVGKPDEVTAKPSADVKAEQWTYRRIIKSTVIQTANTERRIPAFTGYTAAGPIIGEAIEPDYRLKYARLYQITSLLMIDGKLFLGRQWQERREEFAN